MSKTWSTDFAGGNLIYQMDVLSKAANDASEDRFKAFTGLEIRTIRVLRLIGNNPGITFAEIVERAGLERSLASRMIQHLVREGHIERRNSPEDARRFELYVTPRGATARRRADLLSERGLEILYAPLSSEEVATLSATLEKLAHWVDSAAFLEKSAVAFDEIMEAEGEDAPS